jgi:hypothetical protein
MALVYVSVKSKQSKKKGVQPYAKPRVAPAYAQGVYKPSKPFHRTTEYVPSVESTGYSCCAKKEDKVYTGDSIVGIGTMHKSNAVPIFNDSQAKDIATMRRN